MTDLEKLAREVATAIEQSGCYVEIRILAALRQVQAETREEDADLFRRLATWVDSEEVQGAFSLAYVHGQRVSEEYSAAAQAMWDEVRAIRKAAEEAR